MRRNLFSRYFSRFRRAPRRAVPARRPGFAPRLEALEDRRLLSANFLLENPAQFSSYVGVGFQRNQVAQLLAPRGLTTADYAIAINWGNGVTSAGELADQGPSPYGECYAVKGSNVYESLADAADTITVTVTPRGQLVGAPQTLDVPVPRLFAMLSGIPGTPPPTPPLTGTPQDVSLVVEHLVSGQYVNTRVGDTSPVLVGDVLGFIHNLPDYNINDFRPYINWGDSAGWTLGTLKYVPGGPIEIYGTPPYQSPNPDGHPYPIVTCVTGPDGTSKVEQTAEAYVAANVNPVQAMLPAGFTYDPATQTLTITGSGGATRFTYSQATTVDGSGVHTSYTFNLNGAAVTLPASVLARVFVTGAAGQYNSATLLTNDTYTAANGQLAETAEAVRVGDGGGKVQRLDGNGNPVDFVTLTNFQTVYAVAGAADEGFVDSTPGTKNVFVGAGSYAYMNTGYNAEDFYYISGAKYVYAYASGPGDYAYNYDGSGASVFYVSGTAYSFELGSDNGHSFFNEGVGFSFNEGIATHAGQDLAYVYDSPGNDRFTGFGMYASLVSADGRSAENDVLAGNPYTGAYFAQVYVYSFVGGYDTALVDPSAAAEYAVYAFDGHYGYHPA